MDNFIVSARKYRPATFDTVVGQRHITSTLKNAIKNNQLAQAFLFCGPRGVGKTTCARILAKTINCEHLTEQVEACGTCARCTSFQNGNSFSIHELDAASNNSVEDIRSLIEQVRIPPQSGKYKIYIIDEVHMLSQAAFNAFLKTLEEPPNYAIFILATTEKHKILPTILSRCQIFDFNRIKVDDIAQHLQEIARSEQVVADADALHLIAQKADGGLRDALSMFDQLVSFSNKNLSYQSVVDNLNVLDYDYFFKITDAIVQERAADALLLFNEVLDKGFDGSHFIGGLAEHFRNLLVAKDAETVKLLEVSGTIKEQYIKQSRALDASILLSALNIANQCEIHYKGAKNQRLQVELALLKMCHIHTAIQVSQFQKGQTVAAEPVKKKTTDVKTDDETPVSADDETAMAVSRSVEESESHTSPPSPASVADAPKDRPQAVVIPQWSTVSITSAIPDLNSVFDEDKVQESDEPKYLEGSAFEAFSESDFMAQWDELAQQAKQENKISLYTLMTANQPIIKANGQIEVVVENGVQERLLTDSKIDILNFLRKNLQHFGIDITPVMQVNETKNRPVTHMEMYQTMVQKNPVLDQLRKDFNLDFE